MRLPSSTPILATCALLTVAVGGCKSEGPASDTKPAAAGEATAEVPEAPEAAEAAPSEEEGPKVQLAFSRVGAEQQAALAERTGDAKLAEAALLLAVRYEVPEGWHIYWQNPGETGLRTQIKAQVADGSGEAGETLYPAPDALVGPGGQVSYGWHEDAVLFVPVFGETPSVDIDSRWLVCRESCIREKKKASLSLAELAQAEAADPLLADMLSRVPEPAAERVTGTWRAEAGKDSALILQAEAGAVEAFFPFASDAALFVASEAEAGNGLAVRYRFQGARETFPTGQGVVRWKDGETTRWLTLDLPWPEA